MRMKTITINNVEYNVIKDEDKIINIEELKELF